MSDQSQNPEPKAGETPTEVTVAAEPAAGDATPLVPSAAASSEPVPAPLPTPASEPVAAAPSSETVASSAAAPSPESVAAAPSSETVAPPPPPPTPDWAPASARTDGDASPSRFDERPELAVGAAFAGGLILALILKRLAR